MGYATQFFIYHNKHQNSLHAPHLCFPPKKDWRILSILTFVLFSQQFLNLKHTSHLHALLVSNCNKHLVQPTRSLKKNKKNNHSQYTKNKNKIE